ncbi:TPA: non-hydrolyzing UDP-N-acetylglucosamine 2-epimerase [Streptococcus suis]
MKKLFLSFGTRPEAIKMAPLILELKKNVEFEVVVCVTGQHKEMLSQVLEAFNIVPDYDLAIMKKNQDLFDITSNILSGIKEILLQEKPDLVLVHGDTSTTFSVALAAFYLNIPVGHVEAGLRTYNIFEPFPEEFNRRVLSLISSINFCPTETAKRHLLDEGVAESNIFVTGNTVIDALKTTISEDYKSDLLDWADGTRLLLLTVHRRENHGQPMKNIFSAVKRILQEFSNVKVVFPVHKNPKITELANQIFQGLSNVKLIEPLDVLDFHNLINCCYLIASDSGGIQEEAPSLGKPVLVLRNTTERPEGVEAGTLKLIGTDEEAVYHEIKTLLLNNEEYTKMSHATNPYGDGNASKYISEIIETFFKG